jgi:hypothetical protein
MPALQLIIRRIVPEKRRGRTGEGMTKVAGPHTANQQKSPQPAPVRIALINMDQHTGKREAVDTPRKNGRFTVQKRF